MSAIWRCPECDTNNTGDKCVVCGCPKPKSENEENILNNDQQPKRCNYTQDSLKDNKTSDLQEKTDTEAITVISRSNKKNLWMIIGSCTAAIAVICIVAVIMINRDGDNSVELTDTISLLSTADSNTFDWVINTDVEETIGTTVPLTIETEDSNTIVPKSETDNSEYDIVIMPSLMGREYSEAIRILDTMGLSYTITFSDKKYVDIGENCVFSQKPASGNELKQNSVVELGISTYSAAITQQSVTDPITASAERPVTIASPATEKPLTDKYTRSPATEYDETTSPTTEDTFKNTETVDVIEIYTVYFHVNDEVIPVYVEEGEDAFPPSVVSSSDYKFIGWSGNYRYVTENRDVYALFEMIETSPTSETTTTVETTTARVGYDGNVTLLLTFNQYSLDDLNVPIEGTTWRDYYWTSSNEYSVQIISGVMQTYYEGEATITLTYINDPAIVATTNIRVVSHIN